MAAAPPAHQAPPYNGYMPNGAPSAAPVSGATPLLPNQGRVIQSGSTKILCVADVRGNLRSLNELAKSARAEFIIHTGDFGFYDDSSLDRIADKTLKHVAQYSPLISEDVRRQIATIPPNQPIKERIPRNQLPLSQLPQFLTGSFSFDVPVYTVWGACEDVQVLEKLRSTEYKIPNLHIIDEAHSRLLEVGGVKLRLLGLGGAVVMHKLFDNGEGRTTIAGGQGTMWTTILQVGELVDTANRVYDPTETRVLVTHASPAREGLLNQLSVALKADFSISAGLHFRYGSSYNEFSVNPTLDHYRGKLAASKASFNDVWETVKSEVEATVAENEAQQKLLNNALEIVNKMPSVANGGNPFGGHIGPASGQIDESAFKNMWNFNLADAAFGWLVLDIDAGRIGTEMRAQGFNFAHRGMKHPATQAEGPKASAVPANTTATVTNPAPPVAQPVQSQPRAAAPPGAPQPQPGAQGSRLPPSQPQQPAARALPTQQGPPQARAAQPMQASTSQQLASTAPAKSPTPGAPTSASTKSPAPQAPENTKPTPSLVAANANGSSDSKPNGADTITADTQAKTPPPPAERSSKPTPTTGIFLSNVKNEDEARSLFNDEDRVKIQRVEPQGRQGNAFVAHFGSPDEATAVLKNYGDLTKRVAPGKPHMKPYQERVFSSSSRGGAQATGYRSGGASDSEGGRGGRGGSFRGRGGRGNDRGRGRGRGGRGGQGGGDSAPVHGEAPGGASTPAAGW